LIHNTGTGAFVETYLNIAELAKYLGVAEKTIRKWVLNENIPYRKIMKVIRFRLSEIERWIETGGKFPRGLLSAVSEGGGAGDGLLSAVDEAAGSEAESSGGAARVAGSDDEAGAALSDGAACGLFPDDKNGASAVEAVADEASAVPAVAGDGASAVGGKE
jgi:excisionase family DNA binding protein